MPRGRRPGWRRRRRCCNRRAVKKLGHATRAHAPGDRSSSSCSQKNAPPHRFSLSLSLFLPLRQIGFFCPGGVQATPNRTACTQGYTTAQPASGAATACVPDCLPGFYSPNGTLPCSACGDGYWCPGGPQTAGLREACPANSFTANQTSSTPGQCQTCAVGSPPACAVTSCDPGYFSATPGGACEVCGVGFTCPGGAQSSPLRTPCANSLTTLTATASSSSDCVRVCDAGYFSASPTAPCQPCLSPYYCAGGSQAIGPVSEK